MMIFRNMHLLLQHEHGMPASGSNVKGFSASAKIAASWILRVFVTSLFRHCTWIYQVGVKQPAVLPLPRWTLHVCAVSLCRIPHCLCHNEVNDKTHSSCGGTASPAKSQLAHLPRFRCTAVSIQT